MNESSITPDGDTYGCVARAAAIDGDASSALQWLQRAHTHNLAPSRASHASVLKVLGKEGLVKDCSTVLEMERTSGRPPDLACYNHTLRAYAKAGDGAGAQKLLEYMMHSAGLNCTVFTFNEVLNAHANSERIDMKACEDILVKMHDGGIAPNAITYTAMIKASAGIVCPVVMVFVNVKGSDALASKYLDRMTQEKLVDGIAYGGAISAFCKLKTENGFSLAKKWFDASSRAMFPPDYGAHLSMIQGAAYSPNPDRDVKNWLERTIKMNNGHPPNDVQLYPALDNLAKRGLVKETINVFEYFQHNDIRVTSISLGCVLNAMAVRQQAVNSAKPTERRKYDNMLIEKAKELFTNFEIKAPVSNVRVHNIMLKIFANAGNVREAEKWLERNKYLQPTLVTLNTVLDACNKAGDTQAAHKHFAKIVNPDIASYGSYISTFVRAGKAQEAENLLLSMNKVGPTSNLFNMVLSAHAADGNVEAVEKLFVLMTEQRKLRPDVWTYTCGIDAYANSNLPADDIVKNVEGCFTKILEARLKPTANTINSVINAYCRNKDMGNALKAQSRMENFRILPTLTTYHTLIEGYVHSGDLKNAEEMLARLMMDENKKVKANESSFNPVIDAYEKRGDKENASSWTGRMNDYFLQYGTR